MEETIDNSFPSVSDETLSRLIFESRETVRSIESSSADVFSRVQHFNDLYHKVAIKPVVAGLLFQTPKQEEVCFQPIADKLVVGRLSKSEMNPAGSDLACDDEQVSRHHFEIRFLDGFFVLRDLQSRNGTYVNDRSERVSEIVLKEGDVIHAGTWTFSFRGELGNAIILGFSFRGRRQ